MTAPPQLPRCGTGAGLAAAALGLGLAFGLMPTALRAQAPWWEQYEQKERYLCPGRGVLQLERNADQAALISGRHRSTLFREAYEGPDVRYRDGRLLLILRGDELTLEDLPQRFTCLRTEQV